MVSWLKAEKLLSGCPELISGQLEFLEAAKVVLIMELPRK
jgi:hypothetical protein